MQENMTQETTPQGPGLTTDVYGPTPARPSGANTVVASLQEKEQSTCQTCQTPAVTNGQQNPNFVYAIGSIEPRFPMPSIEKECLQAVSRMNGTSGLSDQQVLKKVLSHPSNRYLARQMCWVFTVEGLETYLLRPRDATDLEQLVEAIRPEPDNNDIDVVIGYRGSLAPPEACNGLILPMVMIEQVYSFDMKSLLKSMPTPEKMSPGQFSPIAQELYKQIIHMADNAGATDEHRAMNYLAVRYDAIYTVCAEQYRNNYSLNSVQVRPSRLSAARKVMDAIFTFTHRETTVTQKWFTRVDVTEEFPYLVSPLSPYYVYEQQV
ncbi:MAG: hypothetical protein MRJ96_05130 [Nitrospirales bacterium]|nr:hypothetical protein [Nitrospira sp.]MDR4500818.1 hypothetical protein [Nitrospirales bacterium]